ncbi:tetratricopeptide repeat protein [Mesorhizobium muleiense]|uniref:Tetratricopeptide repeat-containing protein n=1 Tax=Mesorhizobium muleiense TaxID=1004279 RepID=A0A1G8MRV4_9HYPH|nr:tetratricopeptide repeat protein [Mesorhizobium muleiense]MCF6103122.1 tetratricopeptide repeat protein [Mesorhizobium muleiense]SDI70583.1 Tetratricopeptide repeat-containing protein [Mesorhizobium muleiense]
MEAWISGEAGRYAIPQGNLYKIARVDAGASFVVSNSEITRAFAGASDLELIQVVDERNAQEFAFLRYHSALAIRLFFQLYDPDETEQDRRDVAGDLESLLKETCLVERIEDRLLAYPYPVEIAGSEITTAVRSFVSLKALVQRLCDMQAAVQKVRDCFELVEPSIFDERCPRARFNEVAIDRGCFKNFVISVSQNEDSNLAIFQALKALSGVPGARQVVTTWASGFATYRKAKRPIVQETDIDQMEVFREPDHGAYDNVLAQQRAVVERLKSGDLDAAKRFTFELVKSQLDRDEGASYAAMSLCRLSRAAKQLELWDLQLEWSQWASELCPSDPFTHGNVADALIDVGRMVEASSALDRAAEAGDPLYAATGRAKILREAGKLAEAKTAYENAYHNYRDNREAVHALIGSATVAREMGLLELSLQEFDSALERFPDEPFLYAGKASTLMELGDWQGVISTLDQLRSIQPDDPSTLVVKANALKVSGRLEFAIDEFQTLVKRFPYFPQPRYGLIDSLRIAGRLDDANSQIGEAKAKFPRNTSFIALAADLKREMGKAIEAQLEVSEALRFNPRDLRLITAQVRIHLASHRFREALALIDQAVVDNPSIFSLRVERADLLKRLGHVEPALQAYEEVLHEQPNYLNAVNAKAALLIHLGRFDEAEILLPASTKLEKQEEWRSFILRGLLYCRRGDPRAAIIHLNRLPRSVPFIRERRLMINAIAAAELALGQANQAMRTTADSRGEISNVIQFHALAAAKSPDAKALFQKSEGLSAELIILKDEIARRYGLLNEPTKHSRQWIFTAEQNAILLEAA